MNLLWILGDPRSLCFLGVHISANLTWSTNISWRVGKAEQLL